MAYAPEALVYFTREMVKVGGQSSGIVGDSAHLYGYHRSRNEVSSYDYSVQLPLDKEGDGNAASAVDWSMPRALMITVTTRLIRAADHPQDNRLDGIREFYGTTDGNNVHGRTHRGYGEAWAFASSDDSHLWHVHLSFFRKHSNDRVAADKVLSVVRGVSWEDYQAGTDPVPTPAPTTPPASGNGFPLPAGHYYGDLNGPNESHGGYHVSEQDEIKAIQLKLIALGYAGTTNPAWADGLYEAETIAAVKRFQAANGLTQDGRVGQATWTRLFGGNTNPPPTYPPPTSTVKIRVLSDVVIDDVGKRFITYLERVLPDELLKRMYVTSNFRNNGYSDFHGATDDKGALDFSAVMTEAGARDRQAAARLVYQHYGYLLEMIHTTPFSDDNGFYVKNYQRVNPGYYGTATEQQHLDHIHVASAMGKLDQLLMVVPPKSPPPAPTPSPTPPPSGLARQYTVRAGDTLSAIAKKFGVKLENVLRLNPQIADPNQIHVGDVIRLIP